MSRENRLETLLGRPETWAEPPAEVETRILAGVAGSARPTVSTSGPVRRRVWQVAAVISTVAAAVATIFAFGLVGEDDADATVFSVSATGETPGLEGTASVGAAEAGWWIRLDVLGLPPAPSGSYYEGWVSNSTDTVSIGTFHMREAGGVALWSGVDLYEYQALFVTLQEEGGGHDPSDLVMLTSDFAGLQRGPGSD